MQSITETSKLRQLRTALGVTREDVFRRTKTVTLRTLQRAEGGRDCIRRDKATEILDAMNSLLADANQPIVTLDDLELMLYEAPAVS